MRGMECLISLVTGALVPCVLWWLDRQRYSVSLRPVVWRIREGSGKGMLRIRVVNLSQRDVFIRRIEVRRGVGKEYVPIKGVMHLSESLAPGASRTLYLNPGADEVRAPKSKPGVRVLTECDRTFNARWVDAVASD